MTLKAFWKNGIDKFSIPNLFSRFTPNGQTVNPANNGEQTSHNLRSIKSPHRRSSSFGKERDEMEEEIRMANIGLFTSLSKLLEHE